MSTSTRLRQTGSSGRLLLLHSLGSHSRVWEPLLNELVDYEIWVCDMAGHGQAPMPQGSYLMEDIAGEVAADIDRICEQSPEEKFTVVGVSFGGIVAQILAARRPDLVEKLVLVSTVVSYPEPVRADWQSRAALVRAEGVEAVVGTSTAMWFGEAPRLVSRAEEQLCIDMLLETPADAYALACEALRETDTAKYLAEVTAPTLSICGALDKPPFTSGAEILARELPGPAMPTWLDDCHHLAILEKPHEFISHLKAFLHGDAHE